MIREHLMQCCLNEIYQINKKSLTIISKAFFVTMFFYDIGDYNLKTPPCQKQLKKLDFWTNLYNAMIINKLFSPKLVQFYFAIWTNWTSGLLDFFGLKLD